MSLQTTTRAVPRTRLGRIFLALLLGLVCTGVLCRQPARAQNTTPASSVGGNAPVDAPSQQLKSNLKRILSSEEFQPEHSNKNFITKTLERARKAWEDFKKWLSDLTRIRGLAGGGQALIFILATLILLGLGWVIVRLFLDWSPGQSRGQHARRSLVAEEEAEAEIVRDPDIWLTQADERASQGDFRRAYRAVFLAILLRLDQADILSYDRARTNGDYVRLLFDPARRPFYELLVPLAHAFDARWYGDAPTQAEDYRAIRDSYDRLPALLPGARSMPNSPGPLAPGTAGGRA